MSVICYYRYKEDIYIYIFISSVVSLRRRGQLVSNGFSLSLIELESIIEKGEDSVSYRYGLKRGFDRYTLAHRHALKPLLYFLSIIHFIEASSIALRLRLGINV